MIAEIDGGEGAVGILRKVLMARRVQEIKHATTIFEGHHRGDDRNTTLTFDSHPIRASLTPVRLGANFTRKLNRTAEKQELLGERRLARVGVGNDGKGSPPGDRIKIIHADASWQGKEEMSTEWPIQSIYSAAERSEAWRCEGNSLSS